MNVMSIITKYKQNKRQKYLYKSFDTSFFKMHFMQNSIGLK